MGLAFDTGSRLLFHTANGTITGGLFWNTRPALPGGFAAIIIVTMFTAGASLIVWLGEQINIKGIGNGISIILFAGIVSRGPVRLNTVISLFQTGQRSTHLCN